MARIPETCDAVVAGAGPNGLAAAIRLAQAGGRVVVFEANATIGGAARTAELTLPGFRHDLGSAIHPLAAGSPYFQTLPLARHGLEWIQPEYPLAHPLDDGTAVLLHRSLEATVDGLGRDGPAWRALFRPLIAAGKDLVADLLAPPLHWPKAPLALARFGLLGLPSARHLAQSRFQEARARALFAGLAAHSFLPLDQPPSAAFGLVLGLAAHLAGWPLPRGGAQAIADALAGHLATLGGTIITGKRVGTLDELPRARVTLLDLTPRPLLRLAGQRWPAGYRRQLERFRYGPGVFKMDFALDGPIPWTAPECSRAGTVHLGGSPDEIAQSERDVAAGRHPARPFVLLAQPSLFDPSRAPTGRHTAWAYCHVPPGSQVDMSERLELQIERFAPGFRARILARHALDCGALEQSNANLVGGDITGGLPNLRQLVCRPVWRARPYRLPWKGYYLCSASTPPGGGVHGMCGFHAAQTALKDLQAEAAAIVKSL